MNTLGSALLESAWISAQIAAGVGLVTWVGGALSALPAARAHPKASADRTRPEAQVVALAVGGALVALTRGEAQRWLPVAGQALVAALAAFAGPLGGLLGAWSMRVLVKAGAGELQTGGPYALVRHPLYLSLIVCMGAVGLALGSLTGTLAMCGALGGAAAWRARHEDAALAQTHGTAHADYVARVRAFVPRV